MKTLLLTHATILPMTASDDAIRTITGAVGIIDNRISLLTGHAATVEAFRAAHPDLREIDCSGKVLMPGLINTHCHVPMTLQRSYADDIPLMKWLYDYIWPFEAKQTSEDIQLGAELGIVEMLLGGVTSFVDMYWAEAAIADVAERMGIRALLCSSCLDANMEVFEADLAALVAKTKQSRRIRAGVAPHAGYTVSATNLKRCAELCRQYDIRMTTHIAETLDETQIIGEKMEMSPVAYMDSLGLLNDHLIAAHCVHVSAEDCQILHDRGVHVAHNPSSNMKISSGIAPLEAMRLQGVSCTIGTDGTCSNNDLDMWEEMRNASFLQKVSTMDPLAVPAYEILKMATVNGAQALGYGDELGVIREGALADLILIDMQKPHLCPVHDLVSNLLYCAKAADVDTVIVDGEILVEGRRVVGVDLPALFAKVQRVATAIPKRH
ncbi:MAG: amidohydrolase [Alistipes sp.]